MVKLAKLPELSLFSMGETAENGVVFLPDTDRDEAEIELETGLARSGFFLSWSGKIPTPQDLAEFEVALRNARQAASLNSRVVLQCFKTGQAAPLSSLTAEGSDPTLPEARLPLRGDDGNPLDTAFKLALAACQLSVTGDAISLEPIDGQHSLINEETEIPLTALMMPLGGPLAGTFGASCAVDPDELAKNHFAVEISTRGMETDDGTGGDSYYDIDRDERLPLVGGGQAGDKPLAVALSFDLLDALNQNRTHLRLATGVPLHSGFRTTHGHKVLLTPLEAQDGGPAAGYSYVLRRESESLSGDPSFARMNLLLEGDFEVTLANDDNTAASMPGSGYGIVISDSQHEFLHVTGGDDAGPVVMSFRRGAAHIGEAMTMAMAAAGDETDNLTAEGQRRDMTPWAQVTRKGTSQPVVSEARDVRRLDRNMTMSADGGGLVHNPFALVRKSSKTSSDPQKPGAFLPVLPRSSQKAGILAAAAAPEEKPSIASRLAAERRKLLTVESKTVGVLSTPSTKTTPLGFQLEESAAGVTKITLGSTLGGSSGARADLIVTSKAGGAIAPRFVNDIVRNQLFLIANTSSSLAWDAPDAISLEGILTLSEWGFKITLPSIPLTPEEKEADKKPMPLPLVIIKGFEGLSIEALFSKEQLWSGFGYLRSPDGTAPIQYAKTQFADAVKLAREADDPIYKNFLDAISDPTWTGVLVLAVPLPTDVLPDQVRGLLGGIDLDRLKAHHFAIPVRRLSAKEEAPLSKPFAAIDYRASDTPLDYKGDSGKFEGPEQAPNGSDDKSFGMKVTELKVGFNNGAIQSFACKLDLTIGAFFHDTGIKIIRKEGTVPEGKEKTVELTGRWSRRVVDDQTFETYDFFTETVFEIQMGKDFPLLDKATISRISYVAESQASDKELVTSKFLINGEMDFKELQGFDFLDVKTTKFTGLSIDLRFRAGSWGVSLPKFRFSPGALQFDFDASGLKNKARGFFGSLPLKFTGFGWLGNAFDLPDLGYFSLDRGTGGSTPFMLKFDLDLGSLGSFASALSKFKMELGFSFGTPSVGKFNWNLGMRFGGSGGKNLDIGLEGFLQVTCERYEVVKLKRGEGEEYYGFRGVNARLIVFDQPLPPAEDNVNIFIFLDPKTLGEAKGLGWLLAYQSAPSGGVIDLKTLVLGQRVEALKGITAGRLTTRAVIDALASISGGVDDSDPKKPFKIPDVEFAPDLGWTIGFDAMIYRFIRLGFAVRDPDLAGLLLDVKLQEGSDKSLFSVDILYRKLTEDLGVYSAEIVLPPELRNWQFGAAGVTLPIIGVEIYTDGNWGIDLGYPANKDFSRSFAMSIFPFVGAGGLYYRRVSGPAATLLPKVVKHDGSVASRLTYDPVTEFGMGFRVGLGVVLAQGILNAGLSLTVYGYLEGAFGRLQNPQNLPTKAQRTYIAVSGAVGIMGELYGYVDFGIIKAGVFVQLYVEVGFHLETDRAIELYYEVGVSVQVRVVIARIRVFGRGIEIAVSFSFRTKVRFSQFIGSDRNRDYYDGVAPLSALSVADTLRDRPAWDKMPSPAQWIVNADHSGAINATGKIPLAVAIQPDITVAAGPEATMGALEVHAVFLMTAELPKGKAVPAAERLVQGLTAWALCAHINIAATALRDTTADPALLRKLSLRLAAAGALQEMPGYADIRTFLAKGFEGVARDPGALAATPEAETEANKAPDGMILPMPEEIVIHRYWTNSEFEAIRFSDYDFVTDAYRGELATAFERFLIERGTPPAAGVSALAIAGKSLVSVLFQEWAVMIMRSGVEQILQMADATPSMTIGDALDRLVAPFPESDQRELRSPAAETGATVSRFFAYGQRIPRPATASDGDVPAGQEQETHTGGTADQRFFHAMLRLAGQQMPIGNALSFEIPPMTYDNWLVVPARLEFDLSAEEVGKVLKQASDLQIGGSLERGPLSRPRRRYVSLGSADAASRLTGSPYQLWSYGKEARILAAKSTGTPVYYRANAKAGPKSGQFDAMKAEDAKHVRPAIVIDVSLRRPDASSDPVKVTDAFEIKGIAEPFRNLIDPFAPATDGGTVVPDIEWIRLCKIGADGLTLEAVGTEEGHKATLIQSNLSVEARPETASITAAARGRIDPVADTDAPLAFIRLLRQAAIVNTGGYHLAFPGASAALADLFAKETSQKALDGGARLRLVIALRDGAETLAHAFSNALLVDTEFEPGTVIAVRAGDTADPVHEPGILPILASRSRLPKENPSETEKQLAERFSNLALKVEVHDESKKLLGTQYEDQSFPIGPDMDDAQNEPADVEQPVDDGKYHYRASVPVANIAGIASENVYDLVGGKATVQGTWRDIYGNNWPGFFATQTVDLVYSDRLLGLTGLPSMKAAYWPMGPRQLRIALASDYASSVRLDDSAVDTEDKLTAAWVQATVDDIDRNVALLKRAATQIKDKRVSVKMTSTLGDGGALDKNAIATHIGKTVANLEELKALLVAGTPRPQVRTKLDGWLQAIGKHEWSADISLAAPETKPNFAEMQVTISVERPDPATSPQYYDHDLRAKTDAEIAAKAKVEAGVETDTNPGGVGTNVLPSMQHVELFADIHRTAEALVPNIAGKEQGATLSPASVQPALPSGDTAAFMAALAAAAVDHRIAAGYSDTAGVTEKATWLIRRDYLGNLGGQSPFGAVKMIALGLPPLKTEAYSHSFANLRIFGSTDTYAQEIRDADADAYGREALSRIERLLSPATTIKLLNKANADQQQRIRQAVDSMLGVKEGLAERLAERLKPVFAEDANILAGHHFSRIARPTRALADLLKRDLRSDYKVTSLLLYLDPDADGIPKDTRAAQGVVRVGDTGMRASNYSLPLAIDGGSTSRDLIVFCEALPDPKSGGLAASLLPPVSFDLTHIQKWPRPDISSGVLSYRKAAWLALYDDTKPGDASWRSIGLPQGDRVPNPLRRLPELPSLDREYFESDDYQDIPGNPTENLKNARQWRSVREFRWQGEPQDHLTVEVHYGSRGQLGIQSADGDLTTELVQFVLESDRVMTAIQNGGIEEYIWLAALADGIFSAGMSIMVAAQDAQDERIDRITLNENDPGDGLKVTATDISLFSSKISYRAANAAGDFDDAVEFPAGTPSKTADLPGAIPTDRKRRRLATHGLDILDAASARTTLSLTRNDTIDDKKLQSEFVYRLPTIASGQDIVPSLDLGTTVSVGTCDPGSVAGVTQALDTFLSGLLGAASHGQGDYSADLIFEYEPVPYTGNSASGALEMGGPIMAIRTGLTPGWAGAGDLAEEICKWFELQHPATRAGLPIGSTIIDARVFARGTDQRVLRLSRCRMDFEKA